MIVYRLRCDAGHEFDGWFRSGDAFDAQAKAGQVECAACGSHAVSKAIMAPNVSKGVSRGESVRLPSPAAEAAMPDAKMMAAMPREAALMHMLRALRRQVEANCDYVGEKFADEARKIHDGEADARGIYGEATPEQIEALTDDGIEIGQLPWVPLADS
ncbi:MAG: DUF1178 family protein [Elsteraceae bacterium]